MLLSYHLLLSFIAITLTSTTTETVTTNKPPSYYLPIYSINWDLPLIERYKDILKIQWNKNRIKEYTLQMKKNKTLKFLANLFDYYLRKVNPKTIFDQDWFDYLLTLHSEVGIRLGDAFMLSITLDFASTSVIAQNSKNEILLGWNFDFDTSNFIAQGFFIGNYHKNGTLLYQGVELLGTRGNINVFNPNKYSIAITSNVSTQRNNWIRVINNWLNNPGTHTPFHALMTTGETANTFNEAEEMWSRVKITSNAYFTWAGVDSNEGVIVSRNETNTLTMLKLNVENGVWFIRIHKNDTPERVKDNQNDEISSNLNLIGRDKVTTFTLYDTMTREPMYDGRTTLTSIHRKVDFSVVRWEK